MTSQLVGWPRQVGTLVAFVANAIWVTRERGWLLWSGCCIFLWHICSERGTRKSLSPSIFWARAWSCSGVGGSHFTDVHTEAWGYLVSKQWNWGLIQVDLCPEIHKPGAISRTPGFMWGGGVNLDAPSHPPGLIQKGWGSSFLIERLDPSSSNLMGSFGLNQHWSCFYLCFSDSFCFSTT